MSCCRWSLTAALKYWKMERFIYWLIQKNAVVLEGDDPPGRGICPLPSSPHRGIYTAYIYPQLAEFAHFKGKS